MAGPPAHRLAPQIIGGRRMLHRTTSRKTPLAAASGRGRYCIPSATPPIYACTAHTKQPPTQENLAVPTSGHGTFARQPHQALQAVSPETASRTDAPRSPEHFEGRRPLLASQSSRTSILQGDRGHSPAARPSDRPSSGPVSPFVVVFPSANMAGIRVRPAPPELNPVRPRVPCPKALRP